MVVSLRALTGLRPPHGGGFVGCVGGIAAVLVLARGVIFSFGREFVCFFSRPSANC